jgi:hypothetical protein
VIFCAIWGKIQKMIDNKAARDSFAKVRARRLSSATKPEKAFQNEVKK